MNHKKIVFFLFFISVLLSLNLYATLSGAFAQNQNVSQSLEVSPPSQELQADPGNTVVARAKIRNKSQETLPISVRVEDFTAQGEEGQVALSEQGPYSLSKWTTLVPETFSLKPGEEKEVTAQIVIPSSKVAGGYYGSFVFSVTNTNKKANTASLGQEIASLFLLKVSGPVQEKLFLDEMKAPSFSEFGPVPLSLKFTNTGNVHTKAFGLINVTNMFGQKVTDLVINGTNVFPGASRIVRTSFGKKLLFGKYTATAIMYYGSIQNETLTAVSTFYVIPVRLIVLFALILIIIYLMRKRLRKAMKALLK